MILERLGKYVEALAVVQGPLGGEMKNVLFLLIVPSWKSDVFGMVMFTLAFREADQ